MVRVRKSSTSAIGYKVELIFQITQHSRDAELMKSFISFFNCGRFSFRSNEDHSDFLVTTFSDINDRIIPFFKKYEIEGAKASDFEDFCQAAEIIKAKGHLNTKGLDVILKLKEGKNRKTRI